MGDLTDEQEAFMKTEVNTVLCACPGSGKTYIVARKVHKYLAEWDKSHQGIAVLSFTNVASEEIEKQVEHLQKNSIRISYPHFIGTVDSFINTFIVLKYGYLINENKARPQIALNNSWNYPFRFWRSECHRNGCVNSIKDFHYGIDGKLYKNKTEVTCEPNKGQKEPPCAQCKSIYKRKGIVFQSEVSSFAFHLLKENPAIAKAIAKRFPIILIDESQDTSEEQMAVFDLLFSNGVERAYLVGDPDQSIYEWRNATPKCFVEKMNDLTWKTLFLSSNFRSSQHICNAAKHFSKTLQTGSANKAVGTHANEVQMPLLLQYSNEKSDEDIYDYFITKCKEIDVNITPDNVAIVTRGRIHSDSDVTELWKSSEIEMFAKSAYEWSFGSRKKAYILCEQSIYSVVIGDIKGSESIATDIEKHLPYADWKKWIIDFLIKYPPLDTPIKDWINQFKTIFKQQLDIVRLVPRKGKEIENIVKIKTRDNKIKDFKQKPMRVFFEKKNCKNYTRASIHGVKGETYEALLLHVQSHKGKTLTPSFLNNGSLDSELMRIAYVGMTRPRRLLVVAMPKTNKIIQHPRFPKELWNYVEM